MSEESITVTPLLEPLAGTPQVIDTEKAFAESIAALAAGSGPFAVDAERASGYKYSARAYLIQIKRNGGGLHLIDPIPFGPGHRLFAELNDLLNSDEVILHASTQDLPCLREVGINPVQLFDTELGGRIAGLPRVGLGPLLETLMGVALAKEHSAVDWSTRPLPKDWLTYAALDVELLIELRSKVSDLLIASGKDGWAREEFASILAAPPAPPRKDPWRRTSGMHKIKKRSQLAIVKSLWEARDEIARANDIAGGKLLSDAAIVELSLSAPKNKKEIEKVLRPIVLRARWLENVESWIAAIMSATQLPADLWPEIRSNADVLPPVKLWRDRFPLRYAPLTHSRAAIDQKAQELSIPQENLISPEIVRRLCWAPPEGATDSKDLQAVRTQMTTLGARNWQIEIVAPLIADALLEREPLEVEPAPEAGEESQGE